VCSSPSGRAIRVIRNGSPTAASPTIYEALKTSAADGRLLALASPQFDRTHFVYAACTVAGRTTKVPRRAIDVDSRLGERVVPRRRSHRDRRQRSTGPDGRLYVAFDAAVSAGRTPAVASYSGKVLRLNTDGTTPQDQPSGNPVFATDFVSPRALDWHPSTGALVVADVKRRDLEELRIVPASLAGSASLSRTRMPLPAGTGAAGIAFYRGTAVPAFAGDLFVAADEGRALLRLGSPRDPTRTVDRTPARQRRPSCPSRGGRGDGLSMSRLTPPAAGAE
jgi:glucose/arabinose dehydrogenase